jgi:HEAT repeats
MRMQPLLHTAFVTLLVISNVTLAEPQAGTTVERESREHRIHLAQVQPGEPRTATKNEVRDEDRAPTDDEALALAALEGLMAHPAQRALPIVKKVLSGSQSALVKRRALFVLSQMSEPEAQSLLVQTAKAGDPALRAEAIRNIGIGGEPKSLAVLQEIYDAGDAAVKKRVLEAWLISGSKNELYQAAVNAKSDDDANDAIRMLGAMGAAEELRKLGELEKPGHDLVDAYVISGDLASLRRIADGNGPIDARADAVRKIGIIDTDDARAALRDIYAKTGAAEVKKAALEGMLVNGDEQGVLALYRSAQSTDDKRALLRTLSMMNGDAALQAIDAALDGKR